MGSVGTGFPWRRPRREALLLLLVAIVCLMPVNGTNTQDQSRLCLAQALVHGHLSNDTCLATSYDKASYGGHLYSDKAPGLSLVEALPEWALSARPDHGGFRMWAMRALVSGLAFVVCAFMVGRVAEGIEPGYGSASLVGFALATPVAIFADVGFSEVPTAALGFAAFLLAWRRRPLASGALAGAAVLVDYDAALILAAVGVYVAARGSAAAIRYAAGAVPAAILLGAYDWVAFDRPWRLSYRYVDNPLATEQAKNFFGIGLPHAFSTYDVFAGSGGLLVTCPVVVAAGLGLVLLARRLRAEAATCGAVTVLYLALDCGYFAPYGGTTVPRFVVPCLPFLALGLAPAFAAWPRVVGLLTSVSVVAMTAVIPTWVSAGPYPGTIWEALVHVPARRSESSFVQAFNPPLLGELGVGRWWGEAVAACAAIAAVVVALRSLPRRPRRTEREVRLSRSWRAAVAASLVLVAAADTAAVLAYPYGRLTNGVVPPTVRLETTITASARVALPGDEVGVTIEVTNRERRTLDGVQVTIDLSPGMGLHDATSDSGAKGCSGSPVIACSLDSLVPGGTATVRLKVGITTVPSSGRETITASSLSRGIPSSDRASFTIVTGV